MMGAQYGRLSVRISVPRTQGKDEHADDYFAGELDPDYFTGSLPEDSDNLGKWASRQRNCKWAIMD